MNELLLQLQPLLDLVGLKVETVTAFFTYWIALQFLLKLFSGWLRRKLLQAIVLAKSTADTRDDEAILRMLRATWYLRIAFVLDWLLRIKLPREDDYLNTPVAGA